MPTPLSIDSRDSDAVKVQGAVRTGKTQGDSWPGLALAQMQRALGRPCDQYCYHSKAPCVLAWTRLPQCMRCEGKVTHACKASGLFPCGIALFSCMQTHWEVEGVDDSCYQYPSQRCALCVCWGRG